MRYYLDFEDLGRTHGRLHGSAREGGDQDKAAEAGYLAEPVSGVCNHYEISGVHVGVPENGAAGLRDHHDRVCAEETVHRIEGSENVSTGVPQFGDLL